MLRLKDKVVVITGGSSGIGKALVAAALVHGAKVAVCARNLEKLEGLFTPSDNLFCCQADVSIESDCSAFIATTIKRWGGVDVLINNAGISMRALFEDVDLAVLRELMNVKIGRAHV